MSRVRRWLINRRIRRVLAAAGVPPAMWSVFSGDVTLTEVSYDETRRFADFYVQECKDVQP